MLRSKVTRARAVVGFTLASLAGSAGAQPVEVKVTVQNLAPTNSIAFAPLRVGFNNGTYDSFNNGTSATAPIVSIAEGGSGSAWFPAFASADPTATLGTVVPNPAGPLLPGASASATFMVDPSVNKFFTFGSMVVPSNDYFIGNDNPMKYQLFDNAGNLAIASIVQTAADIWDAGSEVDGPFGAAFLVGSNNDDKVAENGVVHFDFVDLSIFNGLQTAAGYTFQSQLAASTQVYRIEFSIVPAPGMTAILPLGLLAARRSRRAK